MRTIINGFAAAAMLIAVPALADTKPGTPVPTAESSDQAAAAQDRKYCVMHNGTGSRLAKKVCKTRAQWMDEDGFDPLSPEK